MSPGEITPLMEIRDDLAGIISGQLKPNFVDAFNNYHIHHEPGNIILHDFFYGVDEEITTSR